MGSANGCSGEEASRVKEWRFGRNLMIRRRIPKSTPAGLKPGATNSKSRGAKLSCELNSVRRELLRLAALPAILLFLREAELGEDAKCELFDEIVD